MLPLIALVRKLEFATVSLPVTWLDKVLSGLSFVWRSDQII